MKLLRKGWMLAILLLGTVTLTAQAQFEAGKTYVINRNGNSSAYIFDNGSVMTCSAFNENGNCFWLLIPTGNDGCYYIQNARTESYVQSSVTPGLSQLVQLGKQPVEFKLGHDNNNGPYWWIASTDNTSFQTTTDGPVGLNFGANGVVSYYIKTGRGNSYWEITEKAMPSTPDTPDPGDTSMTEITPYVISSLDQIENGTLYTMESKRGQLLCDDFTLWGSANASAPNNTDNAHKRFAIVKSTSGAIYLYNFGAKKFVVNSRSLSATPAKWTITENVSGDYRWMFSCKSNYINMQNSGGAAGGVLVDTWSTADDGNRLKLTAVAEADLSSLTEVIDEYEEELKKPVAKPALAKRLGLVRIPCGVKGAYLTEMTINDYTYQASSDPSSAYVNFKTTDFFTLVQGKSYTLNLTSANTTSDTDIRVFVDWNNDGVYEAIEVADNTVELNVPADAALADTYLRVRLSDNGLLEMDSDVEGCVYDFRMRVVAPDIPDAITSAEDTVSAQLSATYTIDGRRVHNPKAPGLFIVNGKKVLVK